MKPKLAYITSMKKGIPSFVAREIHELKLMDYQIFFYITKYSKGLYMPEDPVYRMKPVAIIIRQFLYLFIFWKEYFACLHLSLKTRSLVDFFIACDFAFDMRRKNIHRIHCIEGLRSFNIGFFCKRLLKIPLTVTIYADGLYIAPNKILFGIALDECDKIITICEFNKKILINKFQVPESKIALIPLILDSNKVCPQKTFNILIVAQFAVRKGHRVLFEAVKKLHRDDVRVWVVGNRGTDIIYVDVPDLVKQLKMENQVIFWGNMPEPALFCLYQACDLFCLPSIDADVLEGTPVALMEAMAFEKPVISTNHAGIPEYVKQIIVEQNDIDELSKAIQFFIDNPCERQNQGEENRKIIQKKFSVDNARKLSKIFEGENNNGMER